MDRNTIIGFGLLAVLFIGYFYYTQKGQAALEKQKQHIQDSLSKIKPVVTDTTTLFKDSTDSKSKHLVAGIKQDSTGEEQLITVENKLLKIVFTNKGAQPKTVELKNFKTFDGKPLIINDGEFSDLSYAINTGANQTAITSNLLFTPEPIIKDANGNTILSYQLQTNSGESIEHQYILKPDNYMMDFVIKLNGANKLITQNTLNLHWQAKAEQTEKDKLWETQQSHVSYVANNEFDFETFTEGNSDNIKFKNPVDWIALNQQFFISSLVAKNDFAGGEMKWQAPEGADTANNIIGTTTANMQVNVPAGADAVLPFQLYFGPSDYEILKSYNNEMYNMVPLGSGIFAFVKYVNRGFVMPVFNFLSSKFVSYGLIIALLTIIIRLLISPLSYQSYLSGAKMKLLKPELEELKKKHGDDKQAYGMDQMKLFRSAGVNPLGGCIPALLQIPIFFALYNFFNSNITLRGESFWWASDLSTYDSIYNLPFEIPFYGAHISLFTILATVTSLLISLYGMSNMQDNSNPVMKYLPFIFPVVLLGVFNRLPAALTWYYTVSNVITLMIQFVIQEYIIDHDKLMAKLQENKKKPVTKNKWQEKVEAMQQSNEKLKQMKQKSVAGKKK